MQIIRRRIFSIGNFHHDSDAFQHHLVWKKQPSQNSDQSTCFFNYLVCYYLECNSSVSHNSSIFAWSISSRCQFHQHFTYKFFVRTSFWQLFLRTCNCNYRKAAETTKFLAFLCESALCSFSLISVWVCNFLAKEYQHKSCS